MAAAATHNNNFTDEKTTTSKYQKAPKQISNNYYKIKYEKLAMLRRCVSRVVLGEFTFEKYTLFGKV